MSNAANRGVLWFAVAGGLTATGRRRPRTAAAAGLLGLSAASILVNGPLKFLWRRDRPPTDALGQRGALLPLPRTYSFPSGHSASAFAFGTGVTTALPSAGAVVMPLAGAVAYARVHTGVHYPSDVVVGAGIGTAAGLVAGDVAKRVRERSVHHPDSPTLDVAVPHTAVLLTSGNAGSAEDLGAARQVLEDAGFVISEEIEVRDVARLAKLVRSAGDSPPLVVAAGGDGTVGAAANAIAGTDAVLAIIPLGTSNDVARSLGIPPDAAEAAAAVAAGRVCAVDAGELCLDGGEPRRFVNASTAGLNVAFAALATSGRLRDRFGGLTYPVAAAMAVRRYEPFECTVEHAGRRENLDVIHLSVSNATVFGGVLGMRVPGASLSDGVLDVIMVGRLTLTRLVIAVAGTLVGRHTPVRRVRTMQVESLRVTASGSHEVAADGEVVGTLPVTYRVLPNALRVVAPDIRSAT